MKRFVGLSIALAFAVLACNQNVVPPIVTCTPAQTQPASSVVQDPTDLIVVSPQFKALDPTSIDAVEPDRLLTDPTGLAPGDTIASNCNDGIIRKISKITTSGATQTNGARPQDIAKVYIETTPSSLETVISKGTVAMDFGSLDFAGAEILSANLEPGVSLQKNVARPQSLVLSFTEKTFVFGAATLKVSGNLENNLEPTFNLKFSNGSVERFEVGLGGTFKVKLNGDFVASVGAGKPETIIPILKKPIFYNRTFLIGTVPVVIVVTLEPVIGYRMTVDGTLSAKASIEASLNNMKYGIKYLRGAQNPWTATNTAPVFGLTPTFGYKTQVNGTAEVFTKLLVGIKIYGVAGPNIDTKAFMNLNFNPANANPLAVMSIGTKSVANLAFNLNVLGAGVNVSLGNTVLLEPPNKGFNCSASACTAQ